MNSKAALIPPLASLRGRLLFLICLATLPAILFTFFAAENERAAALARSERDASHLLGLASREHAHQIRGARELLSWLGTKLAREGLESPVITDRAFLEALLAGHPQLANVGVLSPDGEVLASAYPLASYRSWADNPAFIESFHSSDVVAGTYTISPIFEQPTLNHAFAVRGAGDEVVAVLFNGLDLSWLSAMAKLSSLPDGFSMLVLDQEGRVLVSNGPDGAELPGGEALYISGIHGLSESRRGGMLEIGDTGVRRYFVAAPLENAPGLIVAVGLPYYRVVRQANTSFYRTLAGLGVLTLFVISAVFVAAELGILRNLRSLARAAQRFGAGELSARAFVGRGHSELASLAAAFNAMADSLAARHREAVDAQTRLRALAERLSTAREEEATRISRDLHDEIGQVLTSLKIDLSRLPSCCSAKEPAHSCAMALRESASAMSRQIDAAVNFVRRISSELRPGVLDKLGLGAALEWQAREIETRIDLVVHVEADADVLDERLSVTLFRIAQEALNNVIRHARARVVDIGLATVDDAVVLTIRDDGAGIAASEIESGRSLGIIGMRERATLVGGSLSIQGEAWRGTTVRVKVPLPPTSEAVDANPAG